MQKKTPFLGIAAAIAAAAIALAGCPTEGGDSGGGTGADPKAGMNYLSSTTATTEPAPRLVGAEQDADNKEVIHFIFYCGEVKDAFVQNLTTPSYNNGGGTVALATSTIDTNSVASSVANSVTVSTRESQEHTFSLTIPKVDMKVYEYKREYTKEKNETTTTTQYQSVATTIQKTTTYTEDLSLFPAGKYYAFSAYADLDIFLDVPMNMTTNQVIAGSGVFHGARNVRVRFASSEDTSFDIPKTPAYTVGVPESVLFSDIYPAGDGTAESPYEISLQAQFIAMKGWPTKHYKLVSDIDLGGFDSTAPKYAYTFSGALDGNNKTVKNFKIEKTLADVFAVTKASHQYFGLFAQLSGTVKNLTLDSAAIRLTRGTGYPAPLSHSTTYTNLEDYDIGDQSTGRLYVGLVAGAASGTVENVTLNNCEVVTHTTLSHAGGIAGTASGTITNCAAKGLTVVCYGNGGGIVGTFAGTAISNCQIDRSTAQKSKLVGRLATLQRRMGLNTNYSTSHNTGGIAGKLSSGAITGCAVTNTEFVETAAYYAQALRVLETEREGSRESAGMARDRVIPAYSFGYIAGQNAMGTVSNNTQSGNSLDIVFNSDVSLDNKQKVLSSMQEDIVNGSITYKTTTFAWNGGNIGYSGIY